MGQPDGEVERMAEVEHHACAQKPCQDSFGGVALPVMYDKGDEPEQAHIKRYETEQCPKHESLVFLGDYKFKSGANITLYLHFRTMKAIKNAFFYIVECQMNVRYVSRFV